MTDQFFSQDHCDRCGAELNVRTMSWFTNETICMSCADTEDHIKEALRKRGEDPRAYEGCGYIPKEER